MYNAVGHQVLNGNNVFFPTEMLHGLYDGGSGGEGWKGLLESDVRRARRLPAGSFGRFWMKMWCARTRAARLIPTAIRRRMEFWGRTGKRRGAFIRSSSFGHRLYRVAALFRLLPATYQPRRWKLKIVMTSSMPKNARSNGRSENYMPLMSKRPAVISYLRERSMLIPFLRIPKEIFIGTHR